MISVTVRIDVQGGDTSVFESTTDEVVVTEFFKRRDDREIAEFVHRIATMICPEATR